MNQQQKEAFERIMDIMLALPWDNRADVFAAVECNDIFCCSCGMGSPDHPNGHCQCQNDE